jgi:diguanylate cyclase (GGDEF)-like protein
VHIDQAIQESSVPGSEAGRDDRALADRDQHLAEADQKGADSDQAAAGREQAAADSDQAASDRDLVHGGDPDVHESSRKIRNRSAQQRQYSAHGRVEATHARDEAAHARDLASAARDQAAELRDRELATSEDSSAGDSADLMARIEERSCAATQHAAAAEGRARAAAEREQAALDREQAASDRVQAQADRDALLDQLEIAKNDGLTGSRSRATGLQDFDHEIDRAHRTMAPLVVAYIDVVGLKAVNDTHGHGAGDALLQRVVDAIRAHQRSYDLMVRIGGDEFLSVMSGATITDARQRFDAIQAALTAGPHPCEIKVGFAELEVEDSAADLIKRADTQLPTSRPR